MLIVSAVTSLCLSTARNSIQVANARNASHEIEPIR
jgi:hypothetical protein